MSVGLEWGCFNNRTVKERWGIYSQPTRQTNNDKHPSMGVGMDHPPYHPYLQVSPTVITTHYFLRYGLLLL
mgnify:CR=1 FL=1